MRLIDLGLPVRLFLIAALLWISFRYISRSVHYGILLLMITAIAPLPQRWLFYSVGGLPHLTIDRIVCVVLIIITMRQWSQKKLRRLRFDLVERSFLVLAILVLASMIANGTLITDTWGREKFNLGSFVSMFTFPFGAYFLARRGVTTNAQLRSFWVGVAGITVYLVITGFGEAFHQGWLVFPKFILDPDEGIHYGYVRGPFVNASWNGLALAMGIPVFLWLRSNDNETARWRWLVAILLVFMVIPYCFQRAAWLAAIASLAITMIALPRGRTLVVGALTLAVSLAILFLPAKLERQIHQKLKAHENISYRMELIRESFNLFYKHPLTGVGFDRFNVEVAEAGLDPSSHNTPITLLVEVGLMGFLPYFAIFVSLFLVSFKLYLTEPLSRRIVAGLWGMTSAYIIMMMAVELRYVIYSNVLLYAMWGMGLEAAVRQKNQFYSDLNEASSSDSASCTQVFQAL
jgi:putative inorganic carbon (HCO3(-)) transporter